MRDPIVKLNSKDNDLWNLPTDVAGVSTININKGNSSNIATNNDSKEGTMEALVSDNQNININNSSSDVAATDFNMILTE